MNPNQQPMQMGGVQMRPQMPMHSGLANLTPTDRTKVLQLALSRLNQTSENQRNQIRAMLQSKLSPQQWANLQAEGSDPVLYFFQQDILRRGHANTGIAGNQAGMPPQGQRQMNASTQALPGAPSSEFGPFSNVESIMNQQKAGLLAQEAGQMVVPASSGPGRNATPQPMGGVPGPNPGNHPQPNQPGMPHGLQQQFNHPQAQQLKMDQRAAQSQAQIRAQAQAKQMQGQPGGLSGPGGMSQSPGMNTLNTPVRRTPVGMGQGEGQPQMGQPNGPFGQVLDPRFNQGNPRPQMGGTPSNNNQFIHAILARMPHEQRGAFMQLPQEKKNEMLVKWTANARASAQIPGRGQPQPVPFGQGNPMAQFSPGNNVGQQPNPGIPMNQNPAMLQHRIMRNNMQGQNRPQISPDQNAVMDSIDVPPSILEQLRQNQFPGPPQEVKKWAQLKQWLAQKNVPPNFQSQLQSMQMVQFQNIMKQRNMAGNTQMQQQPNMSQQGPQPLNGQMPGQPMANMSPFANVSITPQELQHAKNHDKFKGWPDDKIRQTLMQMKIHTIRSRANGQAPGGQMQTPQNSHPTNTNNLTAPVQQQPNTPNNALQQQRPQNTGSDANAMGSAAPARNNRQPQNNRPQQNLPPVAQQNNSRKRASTDDVVEVPAPTSTPVQRPPSQQVPGPGPAPQQIPQLSAAQLANMAPEQRAKYEAAMRNRQAAAGAGAGAGGAGGANSVQMSEEMQRLKAIGQDEHSIAAKEPFHEIPMSQAEYQDMAQKISGLVGEMTKLSKVLGRWYSLTKDDNRARMFFKVVSFFLSCFRGICN